MLNCCVTSMATNNIAKAATTISNRAAVRKLSRLRRAGTLVFSPRSAGRRNSIFRAPSTRRPLAGVPSAAVEDVHLITAVTGMDGTLVRLLRPSRPSGLVVAATGSGNTAADLLAAAIDLMSDGVIVSLSTRCPAGTVAPIYAFPGGGATWQHAGALLSMLDGPKTRVALALGLAAGLDRVALGALMAMEAA